MEEVLRFALLGLGIGALYSLAAQGLMAIYRGSGILNFAHGAVGMIGAYAYWELTTTQGLSKWPAFAIGVATSALLGALVHLLILRNLRRASALARIAATLGVLILLQGVVILRYSAETVFVESLVPTDSVSVLGTQISLDRIVLFVVAALTSVLLWLFYGRTRFGNATQAVAENQRAAASIGLSPDVIAALNWALGSALAGVAAILISPIVTLQVTTMTDLILAALAAALVANFRSFPIAFLAGIAMGVAQSELTRFYPEPGVAQSVPFLVIVLAVVMSKGRALPLRDFFLQRLPAVGTGRFRVLPTLAAVIVVGGVIVVSTPVWADAFTTTLGIGIVMLSIVLLTGYAGQLSLAQFAMAGFGAWFAGRVCYQLLGWGFAPSLVAGVLAAVPLGVLFALPAVRARGVHLAIVTLGLGTALQLILFRNPDYVGGLAGTNVAGAEFLGFSLSASDHPQRYALVCLGGLVLSTAVVANIRRSTSGRRLLAVRTNERAAAALGVSVIGAKLYSFAVSAGIAALGGILLAFRRDVISYGQDFSAIRSILGVAWTFIGGIGYLLAPLFGAPLAPGSVGAQLIDEIIGGAANYLQLISGVVLVVLVLGNQDGSGSEFAKYAAFFRRKFSRNAAGPPRTDLPELREDVQLREGARRTLKVQGLTVRYGAVTAVEDVDLVAEPGRIVGLIGPNGAGKTSFIDAVTGFTPATSGRVFIDDTELTRRSVVERARLGVSRSFQSLELFEDLTVLDNLRAACDPRARSTYLTDLVRPSAPPLSPSAVSAVREFQLEESLDRQVKDLSYGQRRLLAIARAVASGPDVLLLDEPAAGLSESESLELARLVRRLADDRGIAILLVEHDMNFVMSVCDSVVVLDFGRRIATGTPEAVQSDPAVKAAYLGEAEHEDAGIGSEAKEVVPR